MKNLKNTFKERKRKNKIIILIDAMNLFHRNYHIFNQYPFGTAYGFLNTVIKFNNKLDTNKIIVCWDGKKNWRAEKDSNYKATRKVQKDKQYSEDEKINFSNALEATKKLLKKVGVIQVLNDRFEADDIIALFTNKFNKNVVIISNDKDFAQLVDNYKNIKVLKPLGKGEYKMMGEVEIKEFYGVQPKDIPKFLAIAGDTSDNVKGVYRMGKVKALKLINDGLITKDNIKTVLNSQQLKEFISSYKLVKLGNDIIYKTEVGKENLILSGDIENYNESKIVYLDKVQKLFDEFSIKKFRAFEMYSLFNFDFIKDVKKMVS